MKNVRSAIRLCLGSLFCVISLTAFSDSASPDRAVSEAEGRANDSRSAQPAATQSQAGSENRWFRDPDTLSAVGSIGAVIIAVLALYASHRGQSAQQLRERREELRGVLEKLISLREEHAASNRLKDENEKAWASAYMNTKRSVYLEAAESLASQIPKHVSASEYYVLGLENYQDLDYIQARAYYRLAEKRSRHSSTTKRLLHRLLPKRLRQAEKHTHPTSPAKQSEILRSLAGTYFLQDPALLDIDEGRRCFERALKVMEGRADYYSSYVRTYSYRDWAYGELLHKNYADANSLLNKAYDEWLKIPEWAGFLSGHELRMIANYWRTLGTGYCQEIQPGGGRNIEMGRYAFSKGLEILLTLNNKYGITDDYATDARAAIYQDWGQQEVDAGFKQQGIELLKEARKFYTDLSESYAWRAMRIYGIDSLLRQIDQKNAETQTKESFNGQS